MLILLCTRKHDCKTVDDLCEDTDKTLRGVYLVCCKEIKHLQNEVVILENRVDERNTSCKNLKGKWRTWEGD